MIKKSFRLMLLAAFALSSVMFVSCNKWEDEINELDSKVAALEQTVATLKAAVDGGAVISSVSNTSEGVKFTLSNGQSYTVTNGTVGKDGKDGQDGKPGSVVTIGENGNWFIDGVDQEVSAVGASTFVVDCGSYYELNVIEKVDGENAEIVKINLPKTAPITDIRVWKAYSPNGVGGASSNAGSTVSSLYMYCGAPLADDVKFNGITYEEGMVLNSVSATLTVIVNPLNTDASLYDFVLVDSKGNTPFVISSVEQNVSEEPLTRAEKTPNNGVWDMKVSYASNTIDPEDRADNNIVYALATTTANGMVASPYDVRVWEETVYNPKVNVSSLSDAKKRTINLNKAISNLDCVVDYYFEIGDQTKAAAIGAELDGTTLTATTNGALPMVAHYLLVDGKVGKADFNAVFEYIAPSGEGLGSYTWTVQKDNSKTDADETVYYMPISAVKSALVGTSDAQMPGVRISAITWADGTALNKKSVVVNGAYFGKEVTDKAVTPIAQNDIAFVVDQYTYVWNEDDEVYEKATNINDELFVKVKFNPQTALVGDYALTFGFVKNGADANLNNYANTVESSFNLSIVAPENVIVKNEPYFSGDNAVVYGTADGANAYADLDDLFTTTGLTYTATLIKQTSSSKKAEFAPWFSTDGKTKTSTTGEITVPVYAKATANYSVGTTQEFTATKTLFPRVEATTYKFNVTVKSPVVVSYTGAAKAINNDPITIDASEFTGKSMKDGSALYVGKVGNNDVNTAYFTKENVTVVAKDEDNSKYITVKASSFNNGTTVDYKDAEDNLLYSAQAVVVERVAGIQLQSPVTCTVNVTVKDKWGVSTVIPVTVTVNPIQ